MNVIFVLTFCILYAIVFSSASVIIYFMLDINVLEVMSVIVSGDTDRAMDLAKTDGMMMLSSGIAIVIVSIFTTSVPLVVVILIIFLIMSQPK